jgi:hypothetical protein
MASVERRPGWWRRTSVCNYDGATRVLEYARNKMGQDACSADDLLSSDEYGTIDASEQRRVYSRTHHKFP